MMQILIAASDLDVVYDESTVTQLPWVEYHPNPNGFFNSDDHFIKSGQAVKIPSYRWGGFRPTPPFKVVRCVRDELTRRRSWFRGWSREEGEAKRIAWEEGELYLPEHTTVRYEDMLTNPTAVLVRLLDNGWPIDVEKAISVIDPKLRRSDV